MKCCLLAVAALSAAFTVARADSTWKASGASGTWDDPGCWDGGVPAGEVTATIAYNDDARLLTLTPALNFTGTIVCGRDNRDWANGIATMLRLNVLDGATWKVSGDGHIYATDGIAGRIASSFTGLVVIPEDQSFVAADTLNDNVQFAGKGTLTLTKAAQLSHISGFVGTLIWNGPDVTLSPEDTTLIQRRTLKLGDGAGVNYAERYLSVNASRAIADFSDTSAWKFNCSDPGTSTQFDLDKSAPKVNAAGGLELVTDAGQIRTAVFKGCRLKSYDSWGIHFRATPSLPADSKFVRAGKTQSWSGTLGILMTDADDTVGSEYYTQPVPGGSGVQMSTTNNVIGWYVPNVNDAKQGLTSAVSGGYRRSVGGDVDLLRTFDVDVAFQDGFMTVTLSQDGKVFSMQRHWFNSKYTLGKCESGYYIAIGASSHWYGDSYGEVPWTKWTLDDFSGWYRAREDGAWTQTGAETDFYPITPEKWKARTYSADGVYEDDVIDPDGSFQFQPAEKYRRTVLGSKIQLSPGKRYLVNFDFDHGAGSGTEYTEFIHFGFVRNHENYTSWIFNWGHIGSSHLDNYTRPLMVEVKPYDGIFWFYGMHNWWTTSDQWEGFSSQNFSWPKNPANTCMHLSYIYDGKCGVYLQSHSKQESINASWIAPATLADEYSSRSAMYLAFVNCQNWAYVRNNVRNITVKEISGNTSPYFTGTLAVEANATASFKADAYDTSSSVPAATVRKVALAAGSRLNTASTVADSKIAVDTVVITGGGASIAAATPTVLGGRFEFSGTAPQAGLALGNGVSLAQGGLTFVVPADWKSGHAVATLLNLSGSSASVDLAKVRIVTDAGKDVTSKVNLLFKDNCLVADFNRGTVITIR